ncbi:hypothetical protein J4Q44_G00007740 [Coregonus suidteri]|uniref:Uncharacterized protein n=1 Tax=Coregonus suidteri TaxID=861788 RepID=A0AAN8MKA7_9TELE
MSRRQCIGPGTELSAIMKRLCKEAMQKIISLIDEDTASLRLQVSVSQRDNQVLKENLQLMDGDLRTTRGLGEEGAEDRKTQGTDVTKFERLSEVNSGMSSETEEESAEWITLKEDTLLQDTQTGHTHEDADGESRTEAGEDATIDHNLEEEITTPLSPAKAQEDQDLQPAAPTDISNDAKMVAPTVHQMRLRVILPCIYREQTATVASSLINQPVIEETRLEAAELIIEETA